MKYSRNVILNNLFIKNKKTIKSCLFENVPIRLIGTIKFAMETKIKASPLTARDFQETPRGDIGRSVVPNRSNQNQIKVNRNNGANVKANKWGGPYL